MNPYGLDTSHFAGRIFAFPACVTLMIKILYIKIKEITTLTGNKYCSMASTIFILEIFATTQDRFVLSSGDIPQIKLTSKKMSAIFIPLIIYVIIFIFFFSHNIILLLAKSRNNLKECSYGKNCL